MTLEQKILIYIRLKKKFIQLHELMDWFNIDEEKATKILDTIWSWEKLTKENEHVFKNSTEQTS